MSGTSYSDTCPSCGSDLQSYSDHKPISRNWHECLHCGFTCFPETDQMSLKHLNELRKNYNYDNDLRKEDSEYLEPLDELPPCLTEQDEWYRRTLRTIINK